MHALRQELGDRATELLSGFQYDLTPAVLRIDPFQRLWFTTRGLP